MAIKITSKNYSTRGHSAGNAFPLANVGQLVTDVLEFTVGYDFTSTASMQAQFLSEFSLRIIGADLSTFGWTVGSTLDFTGTIDTGTSSVSFTAMAKIIDSISGDTVTFTTTLDPASSGLVVGAIMPMTAGGGAANTVLLLESSISSSESIEIYHNQVENANAGTPFSLFDGEVNRFEFTGVNAMIVTDTLNGIQIGKKSGGSYISAVLERLADAGGLKKYSITFVYANPYQFLEADFSTPAPFVASKSLKPFYTIQCFPVANDPNSALQLDYANTLGNIGYLNENYNQGPNDFTVESVVFTTLAGDPLTVVDYNQTTHVVATVSGPANFADFAEFQFNLIPEISTVKNQLARQLDIICLSNCFVELSPATVISQAFGQSGAELLIDNAGVTIGTSEITLEFDLVPSVEFTAYVDAMPADARLYRLAATVESTGGTTNENNAVTLTLSQGTLEAAPVIGGPYDNVSFNGFFNHSQPIDGVSEIVYNGCTEDDFLYVSRFNLIKNEAWTNLEVSVRVVNDSSGQYFELLSRNVPFSPYTTDLDGVIHINFNEAIGQALDSTDRNKLEVKNTGTDTATDYEVQIIWSLMANWRYWIAQNNALLDFFDTGLPQNGLNAEWMRYLREAGYSLKVRCTLTDSAGTSYYWGSGINLQDYDADELVTSVIKYYDADDVEQAALISGQIMRIEATHTLSAGAWDVGNVWGWIGFRPFEAEVMRRIGTVWTWTSQNLPLRPLSGETKAVLSFPSAAVAVVECTIDTTLLNVNNYTAVSRIESPVYPSCASPIDYLFDAVIAGSNYESEYVSVLEKFLDNGLDVTHANMCCPTCVMTSEVDGLDYELWAFGSAALVASLGTRFVTEYCCRDEYDTVGACEATFDDILDALFDELTGDITALKAPKPTQSNYFSGNGMQKLSDRIIALTTDEVIRYNILNMLIQKGVQAWCREDGVKRIAKI